MQFPSESSPAVHCENSCQPCAGQGGLGARFPGCLEEIMLGRVREGIDEEKRDAAIIRVVLKKLLTAVKGLHSLGEQVPVANFKTQ